MDAREERLEWLRAMSNDEGKAGEPPDAVTAAALAIAEAHGWWYDPVLSPETVLEIAELVDHTIRAFE